MVRAVVGLVLVVPLLLATLQNMEPRIANDDIRIVANTWIQQNLPLGTTLLTDSYTTQLSSEDYDVVVAFLGELVHWSEHSPKLRPEGFLGTIGEHWRERTADELLTAIEEAGVEYVVLSDLWVDLFASEQNKYPVEHDVYEALQDAYSVVHRFDHEDASLAWPVTILKVAGRDASD